MAGTLRFSEEKINYIRLHLLVSDIGTKGLRENFDQRSKFKPHVLQSTLQNDLAVLQRLKNHVIRADQWDLLFPPSGSEPDSNQFDITLLVTLLRNLEGLGEPDAFPWNQLPAENDTEIYHDIARLKYYRNKYAHCKTPSVSDADFLTDRTDLELAILRIVPAASKGQYITDIKDLLTHSLSQEYIAERLDKILTIIVEWKERGNPMSEDQPIINMSEVFAILKEKLKRVYKRNFEIAQSLSSAEVSSMFEVISKFFVNLDLEIRCSNFEKEQSTRSELEKQNKLYTTADIIKLLTEDFNPNMLPILIEADAGVGKTTLLHRLTYDWFKGHKDMDKFKLVFLIPLRHVRSKRLEDIICDDLKLVKENQKQALKRCLEEKPEEILFLLDGLDEVNLNSECQLHKLLKQGNHVFCSSRPTLGKRDFDVPQFLYVRLLGFSDETLTEYIDKYAERYVGRQQISTADALLMECRKHFYCKSLIKIPLYAGIFCYLWNREIGSLPDTATQLFNQCLMEVLTTYATRKKIRVEPQPKVRFKYSPVESTVPSEIRRLLKCIAQLSYQTLTAGKVCFSLSEIYSHDLSLDDITDIGLFAVEEVGSVIYFRHKLFHEYFAGLYLELNCEEITNIFNNYRDEILTRSHILQNAFFFAAGFSEKALEQTVKSLKVNASTQDSKTEQLFNPSEYDHITLAFYMQLLFERNKYRNSSYTLPSNLTTIPVHCGSVHSLAAALHMLEQREECSRTTLRSLILIDGPVLDPNQLDAVLEECNCKKFITHVRLMGSTEKLVVAVMALTWMNIKGIAFENCQVLVPSMKLVKAFPNVESIVYDPNTRKHGKVSSQVFDDPDNEVLPRNNFVLLREVKRNEDMQQYAFPAYPSSLCVTIDFHHDDKELPMSRKDCLPNPVTSIIQETNTSVTKRKIPGDMSNYTLAKKLQKIDFLHDDDSFSIFDRGGDMDYNAIKCILEVYSQNMEVKQLYLHVVGQACMDAILCLAWPHIENTEYRFCQVFFPVSIIADKFPKLVQVVFDSDTQSNGKAFQKECITNQNAKIVVQFLHNCFPNAVCKECLGKHPDSRQLAIIPEKPANENFTDGLLKDSISVVCLHEWTVHKDFSVARIFSKSILNHLKELHMSDCSYEYSKFMRRKRKTKKPSDGGLPCLKVCKKVMKNALSVLQQHGAIWQATIGSTLTYQVDISSERTSTTEEIIFSYKEMKTICAEKSREKTVQNVFLPKIKEELAQKHGSSLDWSDLKQDGSKCSISCTEQKTLTVTFNAHVLPVVVTFNKDKLSH